MNTTSRRHFLKAAGAAAAVAATAAASGVSVAADSSRRKFSIDLNCGMIGVKASPTEAIRWAKQHGFESVAPAVDALAKLSDTALNELLGELKSLKLVWGAAGRGFSLRDDDAQFAELLREVTGWAKAAARANVQRAATWISPRSDSLTYLANFRLHVRRLRAIAAVLGDQGIRFGLEYIGPKTSWSGGRFPFIHSMAEMKELIAEINRPNVGFLLDSWHWYTAGETADDLLTLRNEDVVACHLNDAPAGLARDAQIDNRRELPCATGVIDAKAFLRALVTIGYDGPICAEPFYPPLREMPPEKALETVAAAMKKAVALLD